MTIPVTQKNVPTPSDARPEWAREINDREFNFIIQYLFDFNGTKAVLRSGLTENANAAGVRSYEFLHTPRVRKAIDMALQADGSGPRVWLLNKLGRVADADMGQFFEWDSEGVIRFKASKNMPPELTALVREITIDKDGGVKLKLHDPLRAAEILSRVGSIALTREKVEVEGKLTLEQLVEASLKPKAEPVADK